MKPANDRLAKVLRLAGVGALLVSLVVIYVSKEIRGARKRPGAKPAAVATTVRTPGNGEALRLLTFWNEPFRTAFNELLREFSAKHGIEAIQEAVPASGTGNLTDMLKMQLAAGDPPDIYIMASGEMSGPFIDNDQVMPLDDEYAKRGWAQHLVPWAVNAIKRHGKIWGVPFATRAVSFFYRADILKQHGLVAPTTYEELERLCEQLVARDVGCLSMGGKFGWNTMRLMDYFIELSAGPELHDRLNRLEERWDRPEVVNAYRLLLKWIDKKWILPGFLTLTPNDARMPFYRGQAALVLEGDWIETVFKSDEQPLARFGFFVPPTPHKPVRFQAFTQQYMIPKLAKHRQAAVEFLDWYMRPDVQRRYFARLSLSTATVGVEPDAKEWPIQHAWRPVIDKAATYLPTDQAFAAELMDSWFQIQDGLVTREFGPEEAARRMQTVIDEWKKKPARMQGRGQGQRQEPRKAQR